MKQKNCLLIIGIFLFSLPFIGYFTSKEISGTFNDLRLNLESSNETIDSINSELYLVLSNEENQKIKIKKIKRLFDDLELHIDSVTNLLILESGGWKNENNKLTLKNPKDKVHVNRILVEKGHGTAIKEKIELTRRNILNTVGDIIEAEDIPLSIDEKHLEFDKTWAEYKFESMPLFSILPIFSKIINDSKRSETIIYKRLIENT